MLKIANRLACFIFDDTRLGKGMFNTLAAQFITEYFWCAFTNDHAPFADFIIRFGDEREIYFTRKTNVIGLSFAFLQLWQVRFMSITPTIQVNCHLIAELAIIIWNACNRLHDMTAFRAPFVDFFELQAYKSAIAKFW